MKRSRQRAYLSLGLAGFAVCFGACLCLGNVAIPLSETLAALGRLFTGASAPARTAHETILLTVRLPRVLNAALVGAALSLSSAAMQGLLKNPLADGTTLGVSSGASLGAVAAIVTGVGSGLGGTAAFAMLGALCSLALILFFAYRIDGSLSTNTVILIGVIFGMFCASIVSLLVTLFPEKARTVTFWTMGSLSGTSYQSALLLGALFALCGGVLLRLCPALDAFASGENAALAVGVNVRLVKPAVLVAVSLLTGASVAAGGTIGFVGLVIPHMTRFLTGPGHRALLPASALFGAIFLMLCDLCARAAFAPREMPIGVITSFIGALAFLYLFYTSRRRLCS